VVSPGALTPELEEFRRQFEQIVVEGDLLVGVMSDDQFNWTSAPDRWSIAQCIEHLNVTARAYLPALDEGIADAIRRGQYAEGPFRYSLVGRLSARILEPPARFKIKTPRALAPPPRRGRQETMAAFRAYQTQYVDRLRQSNGLDLTRAHVRSPGARWLRLQLGAVLAMTTAHERRHLWQARQVRDAQAGPS
jgi:hypothetical protein